METWQAIFVALFAAIGIASVLAVVGVLAWISLSGTAEAMVDHDATLDVQNHIGDTRPVR